jgi:hypothetical protein
VADWACQLGRLIVQGWQDLGRPGACVHGKKLPCEHFQSADRFRSTFLRALHVDWKTSQVPIKDTWRDVGTDISIFLAVASCLSTTTMSCCSTRYHLPHLPACWNKEEVFSSSYTCAWIRRCCPIAAPEESSSRSWDWQVNVYIIHEI